MRLFLTLMHSVVRAGKCGRREARCRQQIVRLALYGLLFNAVPVESQLVRTGENGDTKKSE